MTSHSIPEALKDKLEKLGYTEKMINELWKWYDSTGKQGVASF